MKLLEFAARKLTFADPARPRSIQSTKIICPKFLSRVILGIILLSGWSHAYCGDAKHVFGRIEYVQIADNKKLIKAKMDTGAKFSSLSAINIKVFERDGQKWVSYDVFHERKKINIPMESPLIKQTRIKLRHDEKSDSKYSERPLVLLPVCIRNHRLDIKVNLVDRKRFLYPMLIGSDAISAFSGLIDPSINFTERPSCNKNKRKPQKIQS